MKRLTRRRRRNHRRSWLDVSSVERLTEEISLKVNELG
jgi:hypothetical protein